MRAGRVSHLVSKMDRLREGASISGVYRLYSVNAITLLTLNSSCSQAK